MDRAAGSSAGILRGSPLPFSALGLGCVPYPDSLRRVCQNLGVRMASRFWRGIFGWLPRWFGPMLVVWGIVPGAQAQTTRLPVEAGLAGDEGSEVCILRVRVSESTDVLLKGDRLTLRTIAGDAAVDAGSACSRTLPEGPVNSFRMETVRARGRVLLVENPSARNGFQTWIRVDDRASGEDLYELRIGWDLDDGRGADGDKDELVLRPGGVPLRWVSDGGQAGAGDLPGTRLTSFENDPLRYDSARAGSLEFRGRVDDLAEFHIRGDRLHVVVKSGQLVKVERFRFTQPLPGRELASIQLEKRDGRGVVELVQRPEPTNRYTAIVRVTDAQGGSDRYHWILSWSR